MTDTRRGRRAEDGMKKIVEKIKQLFCRHDWQNKRTLMRLQENGEIVGIIVEGKCLKCGAERSRTRIAI